MVDFALSPLTNEELEQGYILACQAKVRSDLVYFETPENGAVFSVGSMNWIGSLMYENGDNNVSRLTGNALSGLNMTPTQIGRCKNFFALGMMYWLYDRPMEGTLKWIEQKFKKNPKYREFFRRYCATFREVFSEAASPARQPAARGSLDPASSDTTRVVAH